MKKISVAAAVMSACLAAVGFAVVSAEMDAAQGRSPMAPVSVLPENKVPGAVESRARRLSNDLRKQGYEVARGYFRLYTLEDCDLSYQVMRTCYGNNPAAPYVLPVVPSWPDEWVDPATAGAFGRTARGYSASYRLDPREAIVVIGQLPPPASYLGLQTYLFTRPGEWNEGSQQHQFFSQNAPYMLETFFGKVPGNPERLQLFANISNSVNNAVIENRSGAAWDQLRSFVITPDSGMDLAVRAALAAQGVPDEEIFTEPIPSDMHLGLDEGADDFLTVIRYAMPADGGGARTASSRWRDRLPLVVLRVREARTERVAEQYPPVDLDDRIGTQPPETSLAPSLVALAKAVCQRWGQPCDLEGPAFDQRVRRFLNMQLAPIFTVGPKCIEAGMNCLAPTEDTTYFLSGKLPLDDNRVYAVVGALGTASGNATYVGLGLNSSLKKLAFDNIPDSVLDSSAASYAGVPNNDRLFLHYFARDCSGLEGLTADAQGTHCYSIGDRLPACGDPTDLTCDMLVLTLRSYLFPGGERGVAPQLALTPRFIPLSR